MNGDDLAAFAAELEFDTLAIRAGYRRTHESEHSEAIFPTSSYVYESAAQAAARFCGDEPGNIYSRFTNPTVRTFEERLAVLEGAESCVATASGMSAILSTCLGQVFNRIQLESVLVELHPEVRQRVRRIVAVDNGFLSINASLVLIERRLDAIIGTLLPVTMARRTSGIPIDIRITQFVAELAELIRYMRIAFFCCIR